jgi:hypothetical protein
MRKKRKKRQGVGGSRHEGGVIFSKKTCTLSSGRCSAMVKATATGRVKVEATYG